MKSSLKITSHLQRIALPCEILVIFYGSQWSIVRLFHLQHNAMRIRIRPMSHMQLCRATTNVACRNIAVFSRTQWQNVATLACPSVCPPLCVCGCTCELARDGDTEGGRAWRHVMTNDVTWRQRVTDSLHHHRQHQQQSTGYLSCPSVVSTLSSVSTVHSLITFETAGLLAHAHRALD